MTYLSSFVYLLLFLTRVQLRSCLTCPERWLTYDKAETVTSDLCLDLLLEEKYHNVTRREGSDVFWPVEVHSRPLGNFTWYKVEGGTRVPILFKQSHPTLFSPSQLGSEKYGGSRAKTFDPALAYLFIKNLTQNDTGAYILEYRNVAYTKTLQVWLTVDESDVRGRYNLTLDSNSHEFFESPGTEYYIEWLVNFSSLPPTDVKWYDTKGKNITPTISNGFHKYVGETTSQRTRLKIRNLRESDAGIYTLRTHNGVYETKMQFSLNVLNVEELRPPYLLTGGGGSNKITCTFEAYPPPDIQYFKDGQPLLIDGYKFQLSECKDILTFNNFADRGTYECVAKNIVGSARLKVSL